MTTTEVLSVITNFSLVIFAGLSTWAAIVSMKTNKKLAQIQHEMRKEEIPNLLIWFMNDHEHVYRFGFYNRGKNDLVLKTLSAQTNDRYSDKLTIGDLEGKHGIEATFHHFNTIVLKPSTLYCLQTFFNDVSGSITITLQGTSISGASFNHRINIRQAGVYYFLDQEENSLSRIIPNTNSRELNLT